MSLTKKSCHLGEPGGRGDEAQTDMGGTEAAANAAAANSFLLLISTFQVVGMASAVVELLQKSSLTAHPRLALPGVSISIPKSTNKFLERIIAFPDCSGV